ncbi:MAG: T9SS type A sorting domain-containing protein [Tannerella sp.]|nr:T9SS type A sorting domain-containing protein [Tannerella sp.]
MKKHKRTVEKTALRSSSPMGELPVFPLLSGTVVNNLAAQQVVRPTTVYREYLLDYQDERRKSKYECEYDSYGHITSLKLYEWNGSEYVSSGYVVNEYHQLPNGEFVKTKEEYEQRRDEYSHEKQRYTSAYDNKGMQLWHQYEYFDFNTSTWNVSGRTEARIENGVRTAILYNEEVDDSYTFDSKGRIIRYDYDYSFDSGYIAYKWNDNDRIVEMVESRTSDSNDDGLPDGTYTYTYRNIEIVHNEKYFNPYSLSPLSFDDNDVAEITWISWGDFSVDDYTLHEVYYNIDATAVMGGEELQAQMRTTVNNNGNQIVQTVTGQVYGMEIERVTVIDVLDEYGSYHRLEGEGTDDTYERLATYNEYGELLRRYNKESWIDEEQTYKYDYVYDRERDNQNRPAKTTYSYKNDYILDYQTSWEETYDTWTTVTLPSGIQETAKSAVSVYPNPAVENISLSGISGKANIVLSDVNGRMLLNRSINEKETISVSHLPAGVYFIRIQTNEGISTTKLIKKN